MTGLDIRRSTERAVQDAVCKKTKRNKNLVTPTHTKIEFKGELERESFYHVSLVS